MATRYRINFKSGDSQIVEAECLKYRGSGEVTRFTWEHMTPTPFFLDDHAIESIWELE